MILETFLVLSGGFIAYLLYLVLEAWLDTKTAPRQEMFWCNAHGAILKAHCITLLDSPYCPRCFTERMKSAEKIK